MNTLLLNVGSVLSLVLVIIFILAWLARRFNLTPNLVKKPYQIQIKGACSLGARERVVIVEIEEHWLVLGVTATQITHLQTLAAPVGDPPDEPEPLADKTFQHLIRTVLKKQPRK